MIIKTTTEGTTKTKTIVVEVENKISEETVVLKDGSWDGEVNSPKTEGTGLIPVYYNEETGEAIELTGSSSQEEWDKWYDYSTTEKEWANAITKDEDNNITGYFVWIPRYAYKIESGWNQDSTTLSSVGGSGTISIKFLKDDTDYDSTGTLIDATYAEATANAETTNAMSEYVVHPAFTDDTANGGWDDDLRGFWVAKFPAGYQQNTITDNNGTLSTTISNSGNASDIVRSSKPYTSYNTSYTTNAVGDTLSSLPTMSLPVFKPLTYAYNNITIGDSYTLARQIASSTSFYGLSNVDSHQMKNSEWGAVAYLAQSSYGKASEPYINNYYTSTSSPYKTAITGVYEGTTDSETGMNNASTTTITDTKAYYSSTGVNGSSTGNIYGVYDLNGCVWERVSGYVNNSYIQDTTSNYYKYGQSLITETEEKYKTIYNMGTTDTRPNNYAANSSKYGDAVYEISSNGENNPTAWNADYSNFPYTTSPFFVRGGCYNNTGNAGLFAFSSNNGYASYSHGFRVCLSF